MPETNDFQLIYNGITAVASRCDGALEQDGVGFNGQDTKFGRRIAAVPFEEWTYDIKVEAARIAQTYRQQILSYTGVDVTELEAVKAAVQLETNTVARDQARGFEKAAEREAQAEALINKRKAVALPNQKLQLTWDKKDPQCFGVLLSEVKQLPGRRWDGQANIVDFSQEAIDFINRHHLAHDFNLSSIQKAADVLALQHRAAAKAEGARVQALLEAPQIVLSGTAQVKITTPYSADIVAATRQLPGRRYNSADKTNTADLHVDVLAFAERFNLRVAPEVREALATVAGSQAAEAAQENLLRAVSNLADPAELPAAFLAQVKAVLA